MDQKIKESLEKALDSGKDALENLKIITKNITKEVMEESKEEGKDLKETAGVLFKEILKALGELGKSSLEYVKAAGRGFKEGLKESSVDDNNLVKALGASSLESLQHLGAAGIYVTKETAKSIYSALEGILKKDDW